MNRLRTWAALACLLAPLAAGQNIVTFQVDMKQARDQGYLDLRMGDAVVLRGSFNKWAGDEATLHRQEGSEIFSLSYQVPAEADDFIQFKYVIRHHSLGDIWESCPDPANPPDGNRRLRLTGTPVTAALTQFDLPDPSTKHAATFTPEQLREDLSQLRKALEEGPEVLYDYTPKERYDSLFEASFRRLDRPMTTREFYRIIGEVTAQKGCLHTSLWIPPGYWFTTPVNLLPVRINVLGKQAYVTRFYRDSGGIPEGSDVVAINRTPMPEILATMKSLISADAYNDAYRIHKINEGFSFRYGLTFGFPRTFEFDFRLKDSSAAQTSTLPAVDYETVGRFGLEENTTEYNALEQEITLLVHPENDRAVLTLRSFAYYRNRDVFTRALDSIFAIIADSTIHNVIVDLRPNNGGNPFCAAHLLSYLEPYPVPYFAKAYGRYGELADPVPVAPRPFRGRLVTLINGNNVSTTPHFCALLKYHRIGVLVGTETGGGYACNDAAQTIQLTHTKFYVVLSHRSYEAAVKGFSRSRGIMPDHVVESTVEDLLRGRDVQMDYACRLLRR